MEMNWDYIAGFFDGEGSITHTIGRSYRVSFAQCHYGVLYKIREFLQIQCPGIHTWITYKQPTSITVQDQWYLAFSKSTSVRFFLQQIRDRVIVKKELLEYVLENLTDTVSHKITPEMNEQILELRSKGLSQTAIAQKLGISQYAVWRRCKPS